MKVILFFIISLISGFAVAAPAESVLSKDFFYSVLDSCQTTGASLQTGKIQASSKEFTLVCKKNPDKPLIVSCRVIDNKTKKGFNEFEYLSEVSLANLTVLTAKEEKITQKVILNSKTERVVLLILQILGQDDVEQTVCSGKIKNKL